MKQVLKTIIADFHANPLPSFRPRALEVPLDLGKIITVIGPRRAGKTWYFFQLMAELEERGIAREQMIYLNCEDERLQLAGDYDQILSAYLELYPARNQAEIYFFFDEIQELPDWEKYIRRVYDTVSRKIFLTGSNARMLSREIATSLRGRSLTFELMPLSFAEFLRFQGLDPTARHSTRDRANIARSFEEYLAWGGFPELVGVEARFKAGILQEYFNVMLYRDLVERYKIHDSSLLKYLLKRLIGSFTKEFSVNKFYNDLKSRGVKTSKDSIYRLIDQVFSVYMVACVEKYDPSVVKREMSNRKIYLYDNGFASVTQYSFSQDRGKLLENLVFAKLRAASEEVFFLKNGYEFDFVVLARGEKPLLIQVTETLHQDNLDRELGGLEKAGQRLKDGRRLLIAADISVPPGRIPNGIEAVNAHEWLLA